jgi:Domain of unknown function (DUF4398)
MMSKLTLLALVGITTGCGSYPMPAQRLADAEAATRSAHETGAEGVPRAELHLEYAREEVRQAKQLMRDGKNERAAFILMRAKGDAELALAVAREDHARREAEFAQQQVAALTSQNAATTTTSGATIIVQPENK